MGYVYDSVGIWDITKFHIYRIFESILVVVNTALASYLKMLKIQN